MTTFSYRRLTVPSSRMSSGGTPWVFLAYFDGHQSHMVMLAGHQAMRSLPYFVDTFRMADAAGLLRDPDLAVQRMKRLLAFYGVDG